MLQPCLIAQMKGLSEFYNTANFQFFWVPGAKVIIFFNITVTLILAILPLQITPQNDIEEN
jgi:hypothetical protein